MGKAARCRTAFLVCYAGAALVGCSPKQLYEGPARSPSGVVTVVFGANTVSSLTENGYVVMDGNVFGSWARFLSSSTLRVLPGTHVVVFKTTCRDPRSSVSAVFALYFDDQFIGAAGDSVTYVGVKDASLGTRTVGFPGCSDWTYVHTVTRAGRAVTESSASGHWRAGVF